MTSLSMRKIFKLLPQIMLPIIFGILCLLLLIFPLVSFKINIGSEIFPAFDIIIFYYFSTLYRVNLWLIFFIGIFVDQLYSMPIGTNSLIFISAHLILKLLAQFFIIKNYMTNFIVFCFYYIFILSFRYLLIISKNLYIQGYYVIIFQYLTTIFSYNLLRIPLDQSLEYFKKYAK